MVKLQELYSVENLIIQSIPMLKEQASNAELKSALDTHLAETEEQKSRLEKVFEEMGSAPEEKESKVMKAMAEETRELLGMIVNPDVKDAAIIAAAQGVEHFEIACYGTAMALAKHADKEGIAGILSPTLEEEKKTDQLLTQLAESMVNIEASESS